MIRVGVIGYGYWGPNLVRNFNDVEAAQVVAICDLRAKRLAEVHARYPTVEVTTDYLTLLHDSRIDAIVIATPIATHFEIARQALRCGKHVLVEKPLATSVDEVACLIDEATRRNLILMVDHTFVYSGAVRKIRELVANGQLGQCHYYDSVRVNLGLFQHDVSVLWDLAVHDLSILDYVLRSEPCAVSATGVSHVPGEPENIAYLTLFYEGTLIAHIHINWLAPVKVRRTLLGGSRKMIVYDDLEPSEKVKVYDKGITVNGNGDKVHRLLIGYRTGDMWAPQLDTTEALYLEAQHFTQCVTTGERPTTDGEAGLRVVRILQAAAKSMSERGRPVALG